MGDVGLRAFLRGTDLELEDVLSGRPVFHDDPSITPGCGKALLRRPRSHARFAGGSMSMTRRDWTPGESGCVVKTRHGRTQRIECSSCCSRV